jgi:hypothetical protein
MPAPLIKAALDKARSGQISVGKASSILGLSRQPTVVYFVTSPSYPMAQPDCFWTDPQLRLASGAMPQNTSVNNNHGAPENLLWFSWHTAKGDQTEGSFAHLS